MFWKIWTPPDCVAVNSKIINKLRPDRNWISHRNFGTLESPSWNPVRLTGSVTGTGTGTRLCHWYLSRKCAIKVTLEKSIWTYHENILITNIKVNGPGIGTDRNGLLAAGPDFAGYQSIIRLAGFCRTGTGVRRVKYRAAGTCRKFWIYPYFWTFVIINYNINHY